MRSPALILLLLPVAAAKWSIENQKELDAVLNIDFKEQICMLTTQDNSVKHLACCLIDIPKRCLDECDKPAGLDAQTAELVERIVHNCFGPIVEKLPPLANNFTEGMRKAGYTDCKKMSVFSMEEIVDFILAGGDVEEGYGRRKRSSSKMHTFGAIMDAGSCIYESAHREYDACHVKAECDMEADSGYDEAAQSVLKGLWDQEGHSPIRDAYSCVMTEVGM